MPNSATAPIYPEDFDRLFQDMSLDFWESFHKLKDTLQGQIHVFMEQPKSERGSQELSRLCACLERFVAAYVKVDPHGRGESWALGMVPFTRPTRIFLAYSRKAAPATRQGLLDRYWRHNTPIRKRSRPSARSQPVPPQDPCPPKPPPSSSGPENTTQCPRCAGTLDDKEVQSFRDPHTDSWSYHWLWRCRRCYWRQRVHSRDSEPSLRPTPVERPDADIGDELRAMLRRRLQRDRLLTPRIVKRLGGELAALFAQEKEIDLALIAPSRRRRRSLHDVEIWLLMQVFEHHPDRYRGEARAHWDKMVCQCFVAGWPNQVVRDYLALHPKFDASVKIRAQPSCTTCLLSLKLLTTETRDAGVSYPNPIGLRPTKVQTWMCPTCKVRCRTVEEL